MAVSEQLRRAIIESELTHYRIGTDTGVNIRTIDRFVEEEIAIKSFTLDALCDYFGMELRLKKKQTARKRTNKKPKTRRKKSGQ